jgi:hypothetical protein
MGTKRICLFSSPRNVSTALMYSWAQRPDAVVVDEPLYGHYLKVSGAEHPGREEIMADMECDAKKVIEKVMLGSYEQSLVFFKHMAHQTIELDTSFMEEMVNLFFIRDPRKIIASYSKVIENPTLEDIGIKKQWELYRLAKEKGYNHIILDSGELLANPQRVLVRICSAVGIPFYPDMLHWTAGARPEDGIWASYWYNQVHRSVGFEATRSAEPELSASGQALYLKALPYYHELYEASVKA